MNHEDTNSDISRRLRKLELSLGMKPDQEDIAIVLKLFHEIEARYVADAIVLQAMLDFCVHAGVVDAQLLRDRLMNHAAYPSPHPDATPGVDEELQSWMGYIHDRYLAPESEPPRQSDS